MQQTCHMSAVLNIAFQEIKMITINLASRCFKGTFIANHGFFAVLVFLTWPMAKL